jgi:hypothetical protein
MSAIHSSIAKTKMYAAGGRFETAPQAVAPQAAADPEIKILLANNTAVMSQLFSMLQKPIKSYTLLSDHQYQEERMAAIKEDATARSSF